MTMTEAAKSELARVEGATLCCRRAEVAALVRFAGDFSASGGSLVFEASLDHPRVAGRLRQAIREGYHFACDLRVWPAVAGRPAPRYALRVGDGAGLGRRTGFLDRRTQPIRGLPAPVVAGGVCDAAAVWRGAFLARGSLPDRGRRSALEIECPSREAALALVGTARRLGLTAKTRGVGDLSQVQVRDDGSINALLTAMGAHRSSAHWEHHRTHRRAGVAGGQPRTLGDANHHRLARAAWAATARAERALHILGDSVPENLAAAGALRIQHQNISLEELGRLADPPMSKDAMAGRLRRLLALADHSAHQRGIPDTDAALTHLDDPDVTG